jgi:hypothetical protein
MRKVRKHVNLPKLESPPGMVYYDGAFRPEEEIQAAAAERLRWTDSFPREVRDALSEFTMVGYGESGPSSRALSLIRVATWVQLHGAKGAARMVRAWHTRNRNRRT